MHVLYVHCNSCLISQPTSAKQHCVLGINVLAEALPLLPVELENLWSSRGVTISDLYKARKSSLEGPSTDCKIEKSQTS